VYRYRKFTTNDVEAVRELVKSSFPNFLGGNYWEWKFLRNPDFDPSLIAVAEKNGKIIGCCHWLSRKINISGSLEINAILAADLAVSPEHRRRGVAKSLSLLLRETKAFKSKRAKVIYTFPDPQLTSRLHRPTLGYVPIKSSTRTYSKLLSWQKVIQKIKEMNTEPRLETKTQRTFSSSPLTLLLRLRGAPPLTIQIDQRSLRAIEGSVEPADVLIEGDFATFASLRVEKKTKSKLLKALITGKIKVKGSPICLFKLYRSLDVLENALHTLI